MATQNYYYKCDEYSKVGRALNKFWRKAVNAARRADAYAKKYGAVSYVQPVQFFEGGVDYLEFGDVTPDPRIWRKKLTSRDGIDEYEPNCMYRADVLAIPDDRFHPSNTWNKIYSRKHIPWAQAKPMKTLQQWAAIAGVNLTDNKEEDAKRINEHMQKFTFVSFLEFYGDDTIPSASAGSASGKKATVPSRSRLVDKRTCPAWLRRAIRAEQDRQALPVVEIAELFAILAPVPLSEATVPAASPAGDTAPAGSAIGKSPFSPSSTPSFFIYGDSYYICAEFPCAAEGLHEITEGTYTYKQNIALRQEKAES